MLFQQIQLSGIGFGKHRSYQNQSNKKEKFLEIHFLKVLFVSQLVQSGDFKSNKKILPVLSISTYLDANQFICCFTFAYVRTSNV